MTTSKPIADLEALGKRLGKDGYPTAVIENAVFRMEAMEKLIVDNAENAMIIDYLEYMLDKTEDALGPASDDVIEMIKEDWVNEGGQVPEGY